MNQDTSWRPGTGAWLVLFLVCVALPTLVLLLVSVADVRVLWLTFQSLVGYSVIVLIGFSLYASTIGTLVFRRTWPGPWELVEGLVLGLILLAAIGAGVARYTDGLTASASAQFAPSELAVWFAIQVAIVLGVLFYCSALQSWQLQQSDRQLLRLTESATNLEREQRELRERYEQQQLAQTAALGQWQEAQQTLQQQYHDHWQSQAQELKTITARHHEIERQLSEDLHTLAEEHQGLLARHDGVQAQARALLEANQKLRDRLRNSQARVKAAALVSAQAAQRSDTDGDGKK